MFFLKNGNYLSSTTLGDTVLAMPTQYDVNLKKNISVLESGGDVLLIPQACLLGKLKGKTMQYVYELNYIRIIKLTDENNLLYLFR